MRLIQFISHKFKMNSTKKLLHDFGFEDSVLQSQSVTWGPLCIATNIQQSEDPIASFDTHRLIFLDHHLLTIPSLLPRLPIYTWQFKTPTAKVFEQTSARSMFMSWWGNWTQKKQSANPIHSQRASYFLATQEEERATSSSTLLHRRHNDCSRYPPECQIHS